jgi:hypothetical protein
MKKILILLALFPALSTALPICGSTQYRRTDAEGNIYYVDAYNQLCAPAGSNTPPILTSPAPSCNITNNNIATVTATEAIIPAAIMPGGLASLRCTLQSTGQGTGYYACK